MSETDQAMVKGKILPRLVMFALPLLGSSLVQQLYNTVDLLFVGNFAGKTAAAAVGSSSLLFTCLIGLFTGISVGAGVVIAQDWGANRRNEASKAAHTALAVGFLGSLVLTAFGLLAAVWILRLMRTPDTVLAAAAIYVRVYFLSMLPMVTYNMGAAILRACGQSKVPFYILVAGGITNVAADALLVAVLKLGVVGAAAATSLSQLLCAILILVYLSGRKSPLPIRLRQLRIYQNLLAKIMQFGVPAGVQSVVITLSNILVQTVINGYGEDAVAAYAAYFRVEGIIYLPLMACGQAITTFVGQNYGAGEHGRIRQGAFEGVLLGCGIAIVFAGLVLLAPGAVIGLFLKDQEVIRMGVSIMRTTFPLYWIYAILEVMSGGLRGMGYSTVSMIAVLSGLCLFRSVLLFTLQGLSMGFGSVAGVYPVSWGVTALTLTIAFVCLSSRERKLQRMGRG